MALPTCCTAVQGWELLVQEVREAFLNARLADHAARGEAWARLDIAGCELAPGGGHASALQQARAGRMPHLCKSCPCLAAA